MIEMAKIPVNKQEYKVLARPLLLKVAPSRSKLTALGKSKQTESKKTI